MLHCYDCGANMPDNMRYCTSCGRKLDAPEQATQVLGGPAPQTTPYSPNPATQPIVRKKKGGALKAVVVVFVSLGVIAAVVIVAGVMFWKFSQRQSVTVTANLANRPSNVADVNINSITNDTNAMIDNAMKEFQKAANDALAAANKASNVAISAGKPLDGSTTRINFRPGATSATAVGTVDEEATFVLRAKEGQTLTGRITSPGGCIRFEDEGATTTMEMDDGDNDITLVNSCGKPTSMVLSVSIK
jgi:hypothetical protein